MKKLLIPIIAFLLLSISASAQEKSAKETKGDRCFFVYSFDKAITAYTEEKNLTVDGQRRLAKSYQNLNQNVQAEQAYKKLVSQGTGVIPEDHFNHAMVLKAQGKYPEAKVCMDKFATSKPHDLRAICHAAHGDKLANLAVNNGKYKVEHLNVNTNAEDYGACYYKDKVVFASSRVGANVTAKTYNWTGKPYGDMYVAQVDEGQLRTPEIFDKSLNRNLHDGPASFTPEGDYMAFTRNDYDTKRKDRVVHVETCFSTYTNGSWSKPVPFYLNNKDYNVGHPSLSDGGNTMYFTSDMPGGFGGADIYKISKTPKGTWGKPENLGSLINTEGDELFPFYDEKSEVLYIASNGLCGLGGLDIFICPKTDAGFGPVYNAGAPLNTQYDDFAVVVDSKMSKGYFSSNRVGGSGGDDIYSFEIVNGLPIGKKIIGTVVDVNGKIIANSFVTLMDSKTNTLDTLTTDKAGAFAFLVDTDKDFKLIGKNQGYNDGSAIASTFGTDFIVKTDIVLTQMPNSGEMVLFNSIYFDLDKYNITDKARVELDKIIRVMKKFPSMVVELSAFTDCRETENYNQKLSERRAVASAAYIKKRINNPDRIYGTGYGETRLVNACTCEMKSNFECTEDDHQQNRRTEFKVVSNPSFND